MLQFEDIQAFYSTYYVIKIRDPRCNEYLEQQELGYELLHVCEVTSLFLL